MERKGRKEKRDVGEEKAEKRKRNRKVKGNGEEGLLHWVWDIGPGWATMFEGSLGLLSRWIRFNAELRL